MFQRRRIVGFRTVVEEAQDALAAAVRRVEKKLAIAARHIERFQYAKVAGVRDSAAFIARRFVYVDDNPVQSMTRIDFAVNNTRQFLIGTGDREFVAGRESLSSLND